MARAANHHKRWIMLSAALALLGGPALGQAQETAPETTLPPGVVAVEPVEPAAPTYSQEELAELVGPVALYPDDLVAIVLPASTYPLQIVQAARFLKDLEDDPSLKPDPEWDESIVALLNYPQVMALLNDDLDWTWRLGEAVLTQQADVIEAIEQFRDRAWLAGNLRSDDRQVVTREVGVVRIAPADPEIIHVPYYEPARVVVYSPLPVYHYYPYRYPVYYYPYPAGYSFASGYFWGVTSAFAIGWHTHHLHIHHYGYRSHPYYGHRYNDHHYYRRPLAHSHDRRPAYRDPGVRHHAGNYWQSHYRRGARPHYARDGHRHAYRDGPRRERDGYRLPIPADGQSARPARPDSHRGRFGRGRDHDAERSTDQRRAAAGHRARRPQADSPARDQRDGTRPSRDQAVVAENRFAGSRATRFNGNGRTGHTAPRRSEEPAMNRAQRSGRSAEHRAADRRAADQALQRSQDRAARLAYRAAGPRGRTAPAARSTAATRRDAGRTASGTAARSQAQRSRVPERPRVASSSQPSRSQASQPLAFANPRSAVSRAQTRPRSAAPARRAAALRRTQAPPSIRVAPAAPEPRASRLAAPARATRQPARPGRSESRARRSGEFTRGQTRRR